MSWPLLCKILRDLRWPLLLVGLLLFGYQVIWARITERITAQLVPFFFRLASRAGQTLADIEAELFSGPGEMIRAMLGGDMINLTDPASTLTISYVHPFTQTVFCVWAIGRSAAALAGEIDRGTMELLLGQPISRTRVVLTHLAVDLAAIVFLCGSMILGTALGAAAFRLHPRLGDYAGGLLNAGSLMFAVSGVTMVFSALGRSRWRVLSAALGVMLVMFLVNVLGQVWDVLAPWRCLTLFYYYQPQQIILKDVWSVPVAKSLGSEEYWFSLPVVPVLMAVGAAGYLSALAIFRRRDLPAPL